MVKIYEKEHLIELSSIVEDAASVIAHLEGIKYVAGASRSSCASCKSNSSSDSRGYRGISYYSGNSKCGSASCASQSKCGNSKAYSIEYQFKETA